MDIKVLGVFTALGLSLGTSCQDKGNGSETGDLTNEDGGADGGSGDGGATACTANVADTDPEDGETEIYYLDPLELDFDGDGRGATITLVTDAGSEDVGSAATWEADGLNAKIEVAGGLEPSTDYVLRVECGGVEEVRFSTSAYGFPLAVDPSSLVGNTYLWDLPGAKFVKPTGIGWLLGIFLTQPILVGVTDADATTIDTLAAQGFQEPDGSYTQDPRQESWDLPAADFTRSPYFATDPTDIEIKYNGGDYKFTLPIYDFTLAGTFSADGSSIGGGKVFGQGDTRELGSVLNFGDEPGALCDNLGDYGLECEDCPDGNPWCLTIEAWFDPALVLEDVTLVEI